MPHPHRYCAVNNLGQGETGRNGGNSSGRKWLITVIGDLFSIDFSIASCLRPKENCTVATSIATNFTTIELYTITRSIVGGSNMFFYSSRGLISTVWDQLEVSLSMRFHHPWVSFIQRCPTLTRKLSNRNLIILVSPSLKRPPLVESSPDRGLSKKRTLSGGLSHV